MKTVLRNQNKSTADDHSSRGLPLFSFFASRLTQQRSFPYHGLVYVPLLEMSCGGGLYVGKTYDNQLYGFLFKGDAMPLLLYYGSIAYSPGVRVQTVCTVKQLFFSCSSHGVHKRQCMPYLIEIRRTLVVRLLYVLYLFNTLIVRCISSILISLVNI